MGIHKPYYPLHRSRKQKQAAVMVSKMFNYVSQSKQPRWICSYKNICLTHWVCQNRKISLIIESFFFLLHVHFSFPFFDLRELTFCCNPSIQLLISWLLNSLQDCCDLRAITASSLSVQASAFHLFQFF